MEAEVQALIYENSSENGVVSYTDGSQVLHVYSCGSYWPTYNKDQDWESSSDRKKLLRR